MKERLKKATIDKYLAIIVIIALAFVPFVANLYSTQILGKFITYMIAALALDILWGYGGLMNLGFAVFFGMGGYIVGISLACQDGLPAFMSSLGKLPAIYAPLKSIPVAIILGVLIPALVALVLGYFIFTSKIKGVFYNVITLAFAGLFELFITTNQSYTGGSSGVNGIASGLNKITIGGHPVSIVQWYYIAFISLVVIYILCLWITESRFPNYLSHGQRQWLEIGMVLAQNPEIITLDEPTAGMTADETYKTGELILNVMKDKTLIVVEHDIDFVKQISEKITVLSQGEILAEGSYDDITSNPEVVRVYLKTD